MLKRVVLPALVGLLCLSVAVVGLVGASSIRADQRHAAALAKEKRDVARFRDDVRPLVIAVFDTVQPLQDADDAFSDPRPGLSTARDDVLARSGAGTGLHAIAVKLKAHPVPRTLTKPAADLRVRLDALISAANALAAATHAKGDTTGFVAAFGDGFEQLLTAETFWEDAVRAVFGDGNALPVPAASRTGAQGRRSPTKGGFIHTSDLTCARAGVALSDLPELAAADDVRVNFPKAAKIIRTALQTLLKVPAPASAAAFEHQLRIQLHATLAVPAAMDQLSATLKRFDVAGYEAAFRRYEAAFGSAQAVSRAYRSYGVSGCSRFFDVDHVAKGSGSGGVSA